MSTAAEVFRASEERYGADLPVVRGDEFTGGLDIPAYGIVTLRGEKPEEMR